MPAHFLRIQTGRFERNVIPRNERVCICWDKRDIENVYPYILICLLYSEIRKRWIGPFV